MFYKKHSERNGILIAACDEDISGKTLKQGDLEFFVNPRFYGENKVTETKLIKILRVCTSANLIGEKAVAAGIKAGIIEKENIKKVSGVPHAQFVFVSI